MIITHDDGLSFNHNETVVRDQSATPTTTPTTLYSDGGLNHICDQPAIPITLCGGLSFNHNETLVRDQSATLTTLCSGVALNHNETLVRDQPAQR